MWGSSSSGSSSVGQQELGCSHWAEAKTHCPGNSPDKKRVITYRDTLKVCFNDACKYPDSFWAVRSRHIVDWLDIFILYWLSGDHNQNLPNGLNASLPPKFLGPCHEATSARSAPSSLHWKQAVRLTSSQQKWRKDRNLTIIFGDMLPRGFTADSVLSRGSYCLIKAYQRYENRTQFWTPDISPHNRDVPEKEGAKKAKRKSWNPEAGQWPRGATQSRLELGFWLCLPPCQLLPSQYNPSTSVVEKYHTCMQQLHYQTTHYNLQWKVLTCKFVWKHVCPDSECSNFMPVNTTPQPLVLQPQKIFSHLCENMFAICSRVVDVSSHNGPAELVWKGKEVSKNGRKSTYLYSL